MARTTSRRPQRRTGLLLLGAGALAGGLISQRGRIAALFSGSSGPQPPEAPPAAQREAATSPAPAPQPSNYDVAGPVANTATAVPVPEAYEPATVDEAAEEAAAAAEAANIGGPVSDYAGASVDEPATEADRPLQEAGEGVSEGQEQTEAELVEAAEPTAPGRSLQEAQIEDVIESTESPAVGERPEPVAPQSPDRPAPFQPPAPEDGEQRPQDHEEPRTWSGL